MKGKKYIALFTLFATNLIEQPTPPIVIEQGTLTGIVNSDGTILEYIGIPYGKVNASNRFQEPFPPPKWEGVFKATEDSACYQKELTLGIIGQEDCLKINVYVPTFGQKPLPVMVWIHGGAFIIGNGGKLIYGPEFIVKNDVILVTFNYRLGILGFLCLGIKEAPGNVGLRDQIAALRWIKKNIAHFGGDPDNVTVFGSSAGAASTSMLYASKSTEGLFNKIIIQSGSSSANWAVNRNPLWVASLTARAFGYSTENPHELYEIYSKIQLKDLIAAKTIKPLDRFFDTQLQHLPCVENPIPGVERVLDDIPYNLLRNNSKTIPVMHGSNSKEGYLFVDENTELIFVPIRKEERNDKYLFASDLEFPNEEDAERVDKRLKYFYFKDKRISKETTPYLVDAYTQLYFEAPMILETEAVLEEKDEVYNYIFNYSGNRNFIKFQSGNRHSAGATHGDELFYLFNSNLAPFSINKKDRLMILWMTKMWTNFAKYGNPTPPTSDLPIKWEPSKRGDLKFLYIEDQLKMGPVPNPDGYKMWKEVYHKYRRKDLKHFLPIAH